MLANEQICDCHFRLTLSVAGFPASRPGQFVQLQCRYPTAQIGARAVDWPEGDIPRFTQPELTDTEPLLRRPLSIAGRRDRPKGAVQLALIYRTIGTGTHWLASVKAGEDLSVLGPLGNAFPIDEEKPRAALVAGGVGIPPMLYLAEALAAAGKDTAAFCGSRSANLLPLTAGGPAEVNTDGEPARCIAEFAACGVDAAVATDDGSVGVGGFVTVLLARWLDRHGDDGLVVYVCGPERMMKEAADICAAHGTECHVCLERYMACGMGACQSCVCKIRADNEQGWEFKLCCADGPVFDARDVIWD